MMEESKPVICDYCHVGTDQQIQFKGDIYCYDCAKYYEIPDYTDEEQ